MDRAPAENVSPRPVTVVALVTAYCPCRRCCDPFSDGLTSTGRNAWMPGIAAAPKVLPYGSIVTVPGYGTAVVDDTGPAMRRSWEEGSVAHLDVRFSHHQEAQEWGRRVLKVEILIPPDAARP
ncbi:MAG: 3D domain-containing protein [Planctomycetota bacterium]